LAAIQGVRKGLRRLRRRRRQRRQKGDFEVRELSTGSEEVSLLQSEQREAAVWWVVRFEVETEDEARLERVQLGVGLLGQFNGVCSLSGRVIRGWWVAKVDGQLRPVEASCLGKWGNTEFAASGCAGDAGKPRAS
jgi:hypothetical protein